MLLMTQATDVRLKYPSTRLKHQVGTSSIPTTEMKMAIYA